MHLFWTFILFPLIVPITASAEGPVERIAAVVNGEIIFLSDLHRSQIFFETPGEESQEGSDEILKKRLDRLIDHRLLRSEARRFVLQGPSEKEINQNLNGVRRRFKNEQAFQQALRQTGLSLDELKNEISECLWVEKLMHERISLFVFVSPKEVERYYQEHQKEFAGAKREEAEAKIRKILTEEKEAAKKKEYLLRLRTHADIRVNLQ